MKIMASRFSFVFMVCSMLPWIVAASRKVVDMSHQYNDNKTVYYPLYYDMKFNILQRGWRTIGKVDGWLEWNEFTMPEHLGTHMDAPSHFADGPGYWRLHQIPPEYFIGDAVVIDIRHKVDLINNPDAIVEVSDLVKWEEKYGMIKDGSIVLVNAGWDKYWGDELTYLGNDQKDGSNYHWPGFGAEAAQWLVDNRKISGVGTDTMSFDPGNCQTFPAHLIILSSNIYGLENVKNIGKLPPAGARLYVMPMNIHDGSGAPTRVIGEFGMEPHPRPPMSRANVVYTSITLMMLGVLMSMSI